MIRVLVVDDDFMVAKVHATFVQRVPGFGVAGVAHTGGAALQAVAQLRPDLVLLDIHLPDVSGIDVLRELREGDEHVDVLVVTAAKEVETVRQALRGGVVHYLLKPFDADALRTRLEQYAATRRSLAAAEEARQGDIDRLFAGGTTRREQLPKGLSRDSAELVRRALRDAAADLSASECGERTGMSRVSARRYLEHFADTGQVEVRLRHGTAGRPERRYAWRS